MSISKKVVLECSYGGAYLRECIKDCAVRGEYVMIRGFFDDNNPSKSEADYTVAYIDLGISEAMKRGIVGAIKSNRLVEIRNLEDSLLRNLGFVKKGDLWITK